MSILFYENFSVRHLESLRECCDESHPLFYCEETREVKKKENHDDIKHKLTGFSIKYLGPKGTDPHHGFEGLQIEVEGTCYKRRFTLDQEPGVDFVFQGALYTEENLSDETSMFGPKADNYESFMEGRDPDDFDYYHGMWEYAKEKRERLLDPELFITYCPICSILPTDEQLEAQRVEERFKSEGELRKILKSLFKKDFPNVRPSWLRSPDTGSKLELDCYCEELSLAFEYQGAQHYEPIEFFGGEDTFLKRKERDEYKKSICEQRGITLIEVDGRVYNHDSVKAMKDYVESELRARGINFIK